MPEQDRWDEWWETDEGSAEEARAFDKIMKHAEMTDAMRRCMHREPALRKPNADPPPQIPHTEPEQQPPALAGAGGGEAQGARRPHVCFTLRRVRLLDVDAKYASLKSLLDALATCGAIPGDREDQITLDCRQEKVRHFKEEETIIQVTYP